MKNVALNEQEEKSIAEHMEQFVSEGDINVSEEKYLRELLNITDKKIEELKEIKDGEGK